MILEFKGEYDFLSNFYRCDVDVFGHVFPSSEHAFMSRKCNDPDWIKRCTDRAVTPAKIKTDGRKVELVHDWEDIKFSVMETVVRAKFTQNPDLLKRLVATGNQNLVEGTWWGDRVWGVCLKSNPNIGENHLGRILMKVREEIRGYCR